jgi:uncharacterized protein
MDLSSANRQGEQHLNAPAHSSIAALSRKRARKAAFLSWLRVTHMYLGLWGAGLALLFGVTGIVQNHRAILKIPLEKSVQSSAQLSTPIDGFASPEALSAWLQSELKFRSIAEPIVRKITPKKVIWAGRELLEPERWTVILNSPERNVNAEFYPGNRFVKLTQNDATLVGTLTRLHMATGVDAFWVLLSDTIAGALIVLSITGLLMWTQLSRAKTTGVLAAVAALFAAGWFLFMA